MLQFYDECLDYFIDRRDFELIQMDTDSMYFGLSCETLKETIRPNLLAVFEATKKELVCLGQMEQPHPRAFQAGF